jgi:hypothetical protein
MQVKEGWDDVSDLSPQEKAVMESWDETFCDKYIIRWALLSHMIVVELIRDQFK